MTSTIPLRPPKNVLWIGTYYFPTSYTIANMKNGSIWQSPVVKVKFHEYSFQFHLERLSELDFKVSCTRHLESSDMQPDNGIIFQFQVSIIVFPEDEKTVEMQGHRHSTSVTYSLEPCYKKTFSTMRRHSSFELKFVVRLFEYEHLANYVSLRQENDFFKVKEEFFNHESVLRNMGYILKSPGVQDIFSGRQDYAFSFLKSQFIMRTAYFAKEIASYLCAKEMGNFPQPDVQSNVILNYIMNAEKSAISNENIIKVYLQSYGLGLNYLKDLARDCIMVRLEDKYFVLEAIRAAEHVADEELFEKAADCFCNYEEEILHSPNWHQLRSNKKIVANIILHRLSSRLKGHKNGH